MNRQLNLLSFGEEAAEFEPEETATKTKKKSTYDFIELEDKEPKKTKIAEEKKEKAAEEKKSLTEKLKEKIKQSEEKKPSEVVDKIKEEIRNISKQPPPVQEEEKKESKKKKSLVALEREKYMAGNQSKKRKNKKSDDTDVRQLFYILGRGFNMVIGIESTHGFSKEIIQR